MAFRIKFSAGTAHKSERTIPRRSVVQVYFAANHRSLAYYNDRFDLKPGDLVFVDGKLAGQRGRVTQVNYSFKIRLSDYKRVISVADIAVDGLFYAAGSHLVTFDRGVLPACQAAGWFLPPADPEEEFASGADDEAFSLDELWASDAMFQRGYDYYKRGLVRYIAWTAGRGTPLWRARLPMRWSLPGKTEKSAVWSAPASAAAAASTRRRSCCNCRICWDGSRGSTRTPTRAAAILPPSTGRRCLNTPWIAGKTARLRHKLGIFPQQRPAAGGASAISPAANFLLPTEGKCDRIPL